MEHLDYPDPATDETSGRLVGTVVLAYPDPFDARQQKAGSDTHRSNCQEPPPRQRGTPTLARSDWLSERP